MRTVGVEEELLLVDEETGEAQSRSSAVLASAERDGGVGAPGDPEELSLERELHGQQIEFATRPAADMAELAREIRRLRTEVSAHARRAGTAVAALATSPLPVSPRLSTGERYRWLAEQFGPTIQEQLTCGCHVHVSVDSDEEGVAVIDRLRPWLPLLLAMSANSPFWQGEDTSHGSYRSRVWNRWPSAGPTEPFGSARRYHEEVEAMVASGVIRDKGMVYFDARLSHRYPTVEVRVADVCLDPSTPVVLAALTRALVDTAAEEWRAGTPAPTTGVPLLRLAAWRSARTGLDGDLLHPTAHTPVPAEEALTTLLDHVRPALKSNDDLTLVENGVTRLLRDGNGARVQRELLAETGSLREMVGECVRRGE
ncbi:glutamate--cysteine ligase [Streptomyces sp. NPDC007088]|uniref:glutamate--cysteine ligase n=1 Tax=Streptomyces sp. NPDC007088 TaxID=3364773 RepID=UPI0036CC3BB6